MDGRRAGLGLARAVVAAGAALADAAPDGGDGGRRRRCWWPWSGTAAVLAVQTRANAELKRANAELADRQRAR